MVVIMALKKSSKLTDHVGGHVMVELTRSFSFPSCTTAAMDHPMQDLWDDLFYELSLPNDLMLELFDEDTFSS